MVLPVPGGPQKIERAERAGLQHARQRAVGPEQMILADHVDKLVGPQFVGKRPRRVALEPAGRQTDFDAKPGDLAFGRELIRRTSQRSAGRRA